MNPPLSSSNSSSPSHLPEPPAPPTTAATPGPAPAIPSAPTGGEPLDAARAVELLTRAGAVDVEVAALALEAQMRQAPSLELGQAITRLAQRKPFLFEPTSPTPPAGAMPARTRATGPHTELEAAERAASTGLRADLLRYLRLRRSR
jgi:hypothetical protein